MPSAVQTLDISPVGRVEGDLDVRVNIQDGVVVDAWTQAELFRGFEIILRDKDPQAGLVVTPRACGICGASHLTCAAWALDTAWLTEVPRNAILARNLGQLVESLQSLPRHHYGLFMIDYTHKNYSGSKYYEEAVRRFRSSRYVRTYSEMTFGARNSAFSPLRTALSRRRLNKKYWRQDTCRSPWPPSSECERAPICPAH